MDMQQLLAAAQQMQEQLMTAQQELAETEVQGTAGGGLVTARVNGQSELVDLSIAPEATDTLHESTTKGLPARSQVVSVVIVPATFVDERRGSGIRRNVKISAVRKMRRGMLPSGISDISFQIPTHVFSDRGSLPREGALPQVES